MTFSEYLTILNACDEAKTWVGNKTVEQVVKECHRGDWMLWLAKKAGMELKLLTLAKGKCANTVRHLMKDKRSTDAADAAIAFGEGKISSGELMAADAAAYTAAYAAAYAAADAADAAAYAADAAADAAAADAARIENQEQTAAICKEVFGKELTEIINNKLQ